MAQQLIDLTAPDADSLPVGATKINENFTELYSVKLDASGYTAADVFAKVLTLDGAGSGLDADLLDGLSSAAFLQGPAGADTQIQFNDGGALAGSPALTFNKTTAFITIGDATVAGGVLGGTGAATSPGQTLFFNGGSGGSTSGAGGLMRLRGGASTDGNGGGVQVEGRAGATTTGSNRTGGAVTLTGGAGVNVGAGGAITATAGTAGATGAGGAVTFTAGAGGATAGSGGSVTVQGGLPVDGVGGSVTITGRAGVGTDRSGGNVNITPGAATGSGTPGAVIVGGAIRSTDGTAALPQYSFTSDPDSGGPHRIGADHIGYGTNATLALGIDATQRIYGKALHNNASSPTGTSLQYIASGTYTPTLTNTTNVAASTAFQCQWMRVGNVVTVSGRVSVDPTAAGQTILGISLPLASNLGAVEDCAGVAFASGVAGLGAAIWGDATNDRAAMEWVAVDTSNQGMSFTFTYEII